MITLLTFLTLVIFEPNETTWEIEVYDYTEENLIEVVCPEGIFSSDCLEPRPQKETFSLDDIKDCAENGDYDFI